MMCWGMRKILLSVCLSVCPYLNTRAQHDVLGDEEDLAVHLDFLTTQGDQKHPEVGATQVQRQEFSGLCQHTTRSQ